MRSASDVIRLILSDKKIPRKYITVGYMDNLNGLTEKSFDDFNWETRFKSSSSIVDCSELRLRYFKYKDVVVWDQRCLMDHIFGNQKLSMNIYELIDKDNATESEVPHTSNPTTTDDLSYENKNIIDSEIVGFSSAMTKYMESMTHYFICQRTQTSEFLEKADIIRKHLCSVEPQLESCYYASPLFHITLCSVELANRHQINHCAEVLRESISELKEVLPTDPIPVNGLGSFGNHILYASVKLTPSLKIFVDRLVEILHSRGVNVVDDRTYVPHITLAKIRPNSRVKRINKNLYERFKSIDFGEFHIDQIFLCAKGKGRDDDGFYISPANVTLKCLEK